MKMLGGLFNGRENNMNLMRLVAAFAVIYGHASAITGHGPADIFLQMVGFKFIGGVAVDVFFVLSGFLICASAMSANGLKYYFTSRLLRIYPALFVCVSLSVLVIGPLLTVSDVYWSDPQTWAYFFHNGTAYRTEYFLPGVFANLHDPAVNGSLWSLPVEVRLYLIVAVAAMFGIFRRKVLFNFLFFTTLIASYLKPDVMGGFLGPENHRHVAMMFMIGAFAWINRDQIPMSPAFMLALLFFAATLHGTDKFGYAYSILLPYCVLYIAVAPGGRWFDRFGDYSYGVYLYGWLSQQLIMTVYPEASNAANAWLSGLLALSFAVMSWHFIEKPSLAYKKLFSRRAA